MNNQITALERFKKVVEGLNLEFRGCPCMESGMTTYFQKLTARLGINKPLEGVEIYMTKLENHVCARNFNNEPLVEMVRDGDRPRIDHIIVYSNNLLAWLKSLQEEEVKVEKQYMSFTDALSKMEVRDIIKASDSISTGIMKLEQEYRYIDMKTNVFGHVVGLYEEVVNAKYELIPTPKYVDWETAYEALENAMTIEGHDPEADHNTTIVLKPDYNLYKLSQEHPSVGLSDFARYQWQIK